jgi:hypothetical protein
LGGPHISLVFREMWDTTALQSGFFTLLATNIQVRCIPHLAKNQRDAPNFLHAATGQGRVGAFH